MDDAYDFASAADPAVERETPPLFVSLWSAIASTLLAGVAVSFVAGIALGGSYWFAHPEVRDRSIALFIPFIALVALGATSLAASIRMSVVFGEAASKSLRIPAIVLGSAALGFASGYHPGRLAGDLFGRLPMPFIGGTALALASGVSFVALALIAATRARLRVLFAIVALLGIDAIAVGAALAFWEPAPLIDLLRAHVDDVGHASLGAVVGCMMGTFIAAHVGAAIALAQSRSASSATISATASTSSVGKLA